MISVLRYQSTEDKGWHIEPSPRTTVAIMVVIEPWAELEACVERHRKDTVGCRSMIHVVGLGRCGERGGLDGGVARAIV